MNWYSGEISAAIQKAIRERKVFIVFVKGEWMFLLNIESEMLFTKTCVSFTWLLFFLLLFIFWISFHCLFVFLLILGENDDSRNMEEVWQDHQVS